MPQSQYCPACLLVKGNCRIENLPDIKDVKLFLRILEQLNADVKYIDKNTVDIDCTNVDSYRPLGDLTRKMRGSSYLMGALLGRFSNFIVDPPGGCDFGTRPIDQHIKAFETLGADIDTSKGVIEGSAENLSGGNIFFDVINRRMRQSTLCLRRQPQTVLPLSKMPQKNLYC